MFIDQLLTYNSRSSGAMFRRRLHSVRAGSIFFSWRAINITSLWDDGPSSVFDRRTQVGDLRNSGCAASRRLAAHRGGTALAFSTRDDQNRAAIRTVCR